MDSLWLLVAVIVVGSAVSLALGMSIFLYVAKQHRKMAIALALPFGAGALLAAAFFDLLPEALQLGDASALLTWSALGFISFFVLERTAGWFHHHHDHEAHGKRGNQQNIMVMIGDLLHNAIDGAAIGAAFVVNPSVGLVTALAVSAHEIPKEIGTYGILLSRGWTSSKVIRANILTAFGTLFAAVTVYTWGNLVQIPEAELLAITSGIFLYIAASDIIPDIHEQPQKLGTIQAAVLVGGMGLVWLIIQLLGV